MTVQRGRCPFRVIWNLRLVDWMMDGALCMMDCERVLGQMVMMWSGCCSPRIGSKISK